jgi:hypothetical protein
VFLLPGGYDAFTVWIWETVQTGTSATGKVCSAEGAFCQSHSKSLIWGGGLTAGAGR